MAVNNLCMGPDLSVLNVMTSTSVKNVSHRSNMITILIESCVSEAHRRMLANQVHNYYTDK